MTVREVLVSILVLSGSSLTLLAAVGLHRMPDVYARIHVATKPATLGLILTLSGAAVGLRDGSAVAIVLLALAFQLATAPVGSHLLARAAHRAGAPVATSTALDELADHERADGEPTDR